MEKLFIVLGLIILWVLIFIMRTYNVLVGLRNRVRDQWAQIDVQLKRRFDLIPNIVETVKGYAGHEKETLEAVIAARNKFKEANTPEAEMAANGELNQVLGRLMVLTEAYPDLKANQNFMQLQEELRDTETKIAHARQFYNDTVLTYNNRCEMFPSNVIANMFHFEKKNFFEVGNESEREAPKVSFE